MIRDDFGEFPGRLFGGGSREEAGELCARANAELIVNRTDVFFDGLARDKEALRDCGISEPGSNAFGDFAFPLRKHVVRLRGRIGRCIEALHVAERSISDVDRTRIVEPEPRSRVSSKRSRGTAT